ncbi:UNVERIFIED_CONTAM: putative ribonuclease H protein [Sesamum angustifolium]|uniref:Ribonuclease H protein n=1 Tax=Sesamum angustifolium TaxID=2727405 RepID=A0AAW2JEL6_9LAMI
MLRRRVCLRNRVSAIFAVRMGSIGAGVRHGSRGRGFMGRSRDKLQSWSKMLQQRAKIQWLKGGDQCSRIFFRKVAMRRAAKRVFQITNEAGRILTEQDEVVDEFVSFYQRLLGGERRREFLDLRYLRPWARHVVTPDECMELVQLVTREEIKDAFFDIAEDKAPGPDGYSSGFYKAAWPVIGEEVVKAILEFFTTGRLLKQVNTTILALIPKVRLPSLVSDFRPISCCNVLYKVITKIIVQRLRSVLDKMISPSQNAFSRAALLGIISYLPRRSFQGNRQGLPMRCALKVDLRKAYDTVEWDFLSAVLHLLDFRTSLLVGLRSVSLLLCSRFASMGNPTGSSRVPGGCDRGIRCPRSCLFLIMERTFASVRIFRHGLDEFAKLSGLHANPQKSQLILSRSAQPMREHILAALQFQEGHLPLRETQLIKSVLMSLNVYWAMAFILPKGVIRAVEKRMRQFLWKGNSAVGYPKVAWSDVCRPMEEGGLGIRDILALNKALMSRHLWNVIQSNQSSIWVQWIAHTHLRHKSVWTVDAKGGSWGWRKLLRLRSALLPYIEFKVGNGEIFSIWHDPWHSLGTLIRRFPSGPSRTNIPIAAKLSAVIVDGDWSWPPITDMECIEILHLLPNIHNGNDSILWRGGEFTTTVAYGIFRTPGPIVGWYPLLSGPCKIPRFSFVLWLAILGKLSTMDKPWLSHLGGLLSEVYPRLEEAVRFTWPNRAWGEDITWASTRWKGRHIVQAAYRALLSAIVYHIWRERNQRVFQHSERPSTTIARIAAEEIRQKILSLDLSDSVSTRGLYRLWRIPWPVRDKRLTLEA